METKQLIIIQEVEFIGFATEGFLGEPIELDMSMRVASLLNAYDRTRQFISKRVWNQRQTEGFCSEESDEEKISVSESELLDSENELLNSESELLESEDELLGGENQHSVSVSDNEGTFEEPVFTKILIIREYAGSTHRLRILMGLSELIQEFVRDVSDWRWRRWSPIFKYEHTAEVCQTGTRSKIPGWCHECKVFSCITSTLELFMEYGYEEYDRQRKARKIEAQAKLSSEGNPRSLLYSP
eukprot:TRINITY_DN7531_c0_g1_i1.p1 TRINITY_DN7531_c0_g1~~TRINITY_DN7531_c0_g1_i1.p1  ORF type:complete len:242 (+),score=37.44 TRINITY_DN7531_c0_g1_i1:903-1628(+)